MSKKPGSSKRNRPRMGFEILAKVYSDKSKLVPVYNGRMHSANSNKAGKDQYYVCQKKILNGCRGKLQLDPTNRCVDY